MTELKATRPDAGENATRHSDCAPQVGHSTTPKGESAPESADIAQPKVPGYDIVQELGRGGMGVVYLARQRGAGRMVALKMILSGGLSSHSERSRFRTEIQAIARLQHRGIVQLFEVGELDGIPYFTLEYCSGGSLSEKLTREPWEPSAAAALVLALAEAIHVAHQSGIIHRDLKPANVLVAEDGTPKIADFGLAKQTALTHDAGETLTRTGAIIGTPSYMAPEQAAGTKEIGPLTDVYGLGAILYRLLTGRPPFEGASAVETIRQVREDEAVPPTKFQARLPRDLETICLKCLEKKPANRYAGATALAEDLRRFLNGEPIQARPVSQVEKFRKWVRRNPAWAALALTLAIATTVSIAFAVRAKFAADRAKQALQAKEGRGGTTKRRDQPPLPRLCETTSGRTSIGEEATGCSILRRKQRSEVRGGSRWRGRSRVSRKLRRRLICPEFVQKRPEQIAAIRTVTSDAL